MDAHVTEQILRRLEAEPGIIARAIAALDETQELDGDVTLDLEELEADPDVLRDVLRVSRQTWDELDVGAHRLLVIYLIDRVAIDYLALRSRNR